MKYERNPNTKCSICEKEIYRRPSQLDKQVFCSRECYGISCRKEIKCLICSKEILSGLNKKTCSEKCYKEYRIILNKKHKWRINKNPDNVVRSKVARVRFIEERGNRCELCSYNNAPQILNIHHIIERCNGGTDEKDNLLVVFPNCHSEIHAGLREI